MADEEFQSANSGASDTFPQQCSALRKGGHVVIKGFPCKIMEMSTSKTGKHGHAKVHMVGIDIFTGKKYEDLSPSTHNMDVPHVTRTDYQLIDVSADGYCSLMDPTSGVTKDDLKMPVGELGDEIRAAFEEGKDLQLTVLGALGQEQIIVQKEASIKN